MYPEFNLLDIICVREGKPVWGLTMVIMGRALSRTLCFWHNPTFHQRCLSSMVFKALRRGNRHPFPCKHRLSWLPPPASRKEMTSHFCSSLPSLNHQDIVSHYWYQWGAQNRRVDRDQISSSQYYKRCSSVCCFPVEADKDRTSFWECCQCGQCGLRDLYVQSKVPPRHQ